MTEEDFKKRIRKYCCLVRLYSRSHGFEPQTTVTKRLESTRGLSLNYFHSQKLTGE